jgi:DNA polymerase-3 subunit epsilon
MPDLGYAVLDFETTGLAADGGDRVIEIAVVLVSPDGDITDRWETLINPERDTGPTHIHGIYPADVRNIQTFDQALAGLTARLRGRVFVAHNASFDSRFLRAELLAADVISPIDAHNSLCTMILSKTFLSIESKTLAACCAASGITLNDAHRASADALATAQLLGSYIRQNPEWDGWGAPLAAATATVWPSTPSSGAITFTREDAAERASFVRHILDGVLDEADVEQQAAYFAHIDRCLLTFEPAVADFNALISYATGVGFNQDLCQKLNLQHFHTLTAAAWAPGTLSDSAQMQIVAAARLLAVDGAQLTTALRPPASDADPVTLAPGSVITLTGFSASDKRALGTIIEAAGHITWPSLVKKTNVLVAADIDSLSSKGRTARRLGIPIVNESGLRELLAAA